MAKTLSKALQISLAVLGAMPIVSAGGARSAEIPATAEVPIPTETSDIQSRKATNVAPTPDATLLKQLNQYSSEDSATESGMSVLNSVTQLSDVLPTDWAYEALRSLVEKYQCIAGYPDGTYRGNRAMTRYEFAAGLNACMESILQRFGGINTSRLATKEDLAILQRLIDEFAAELATLRGRVDALEARTAELEANQFSTTTILDGQVIFAAVDTFGESSNSVAHFGHRTRLNLETSFTGEDLLRTRLQTGNLEALSFRSTPAPEGDLFFASDAYSESAGNVIGLDALLYSFPVGEKLEVTIVANAGASDDFASTVNPYLDGDGASGALSRFASRHPIYFLIKGAGIGGKYELSDKLELSLGYMAADAANPNPGAGFFNGAYGAMAQVVFKPSEGFNLGLTYLHSYNNETGTGSNRANPRTFLNNQLGLDVPISSNAYGVELSWQLSPRFVVGGWVGYINANVLSTLGGQIDRGDLDIWNAAVNLAFPDLGKKGNLGGIVVGVEPMVRNSSVREIAEDSDTSLHVEGFYQYQLTDNISITPGVVWLTSPDHNAANEDVVIGTLRTTFSF